jgi:hypothetical protein
MKTDWQPTSGEAYQAAAQIIRGHTPSEIAMALYNKKDAKGIMRVKSLLRFAERKGMLRLFSHTNPGLEKALSKRFGKHLAFHVVNND